MIPGQAQQFFEAAAAQSGGATPLQVTRSLRFNTSDSTHFDRTPSSASNRKTWTWSGWVKKFKSSRGVLFGGGTSQSDTGFTSIEFESDDSLRVTGWNTLWAKSSGVFRDYSAWYHVVISFDSTQSSAGDQIKMYVNGQQLTKATENALSQNGDYGINQGVRHTIGAISENADAKSNFYLAEVNFIDGQALAASDFGAYDSDDNWNPKDTSGLTFGTNGFHLKFADNSSNSALGTDSSGNGNNWTVNNIIYGPSTKTFLDKKPDNTGWGSIANAFDGNTGTYADGTYNNGTTSKIHFNPPITGVTSLRLYWYGTSNYGYNNTSIGSGSTTAEWKSVYSGSAIDVYNIIGISQPGNGVVRLYAIEVNGVVQTGYTELEPVTIDSLIDTPTNYEADSGNNGGNYCTWNPLYQSDGTFSEGNLELETNAGNKHYQATFGFTSGKWYWEVYPAPGTTPGMIGIALNTKAKTDNLNGAGAMAYYSVTGYKQGGNTSGVDSPYGATYTYRDIIGVALDLDSATKTITFYKNGVSQGVAFNPDPTLGPWHPAVSAGSSVNTTVFVANFGQHQFAFTPPTDHLSPCSQNLADPTIADGSTAMGVTLYNGNGGTAQTISGINHSPDFVWYKHRSAASSHGLFDIIRGANNYLSSNSTSAEQTVSGVTAFNSDGFSLGTDTGANGSGTWVAWTWDAGTSTVSNTDGSITSSVRANASAGFSVLTATTPAQTSSNYSVGHGLNVPPAMWIWKHRDTASSWVVWHTSLGANRLSLNSTDAASSNDVTTPTSSVIYLPPGPTAAWNSDIVLYAFAPVAGYSAFGSYTGNGSSNGPFVYTGFRPAYLLIKSVDTAKSWILLDDERNGYNGGQIDLEANTSNAEGNALGIAYQTDILSNGFKIKHDHSQMNASSTSYIYAAFAEHPFKTARAR